MVLLLSGGFIWQSVLHTAKAVADIATFRNQITSICKSIYDAVTFLSGTSVGVEITSLTEVERVGSGLLGIL